ncbi:MAG: sugar ABC transporter ATP-binding protein, partial [Armatimonadota bacterium]
MEAIQDPERPILSMRGIDKRFGGVHALKGVDLALYAGEILALVGENGAGKSTLMEILCGNVRADQGTIHLADQQVAFGNAREAQLAGISIVHQELSLVPNLTVAENIFCGREPTLRPLGFVDRRKLYAQTRELLGQLGLDIAPSTPVRNLSVAGQQMVEIAKALSLDCKVLVLDEPTSALTDREIAYLFGIMHNLRDAGVGVIYISHKLQEVFEVADRICVLRDGDLIGTVAKDEVTTDDVVRMMVGRELDAYFPERATELGEIVLEVRGATHRPHFEEVSFELHAGEILGLAGLAGAGRTALARSLFGTDRLDSGEILLRQRPLRLRSPAQAIEAGIAYVPEDRKDLGLFLQMIVRDNLVSADLGSHSRWGWMVPGSQTRKSAEVVERLRIRTPSVFTQLMNLSGGNQQKVLLGKWLATNPQVLIVDEPTR